MTKTLDFRHLPDWPKLAWLAAVTRGSDKVLVFHGPCVETNSSWCVEAVWPGAFAQGDFDQSEVMVGTGLRVRGEGVVFVSSGDALNRLHVYEDDEVIYVTNSLPALMAFADLSFVPGFDYVEVLKSISEGLTRYLREIPTNRRPVRQVYFANLLLSDNGVEDIAKPSATPEFSDYSTYRDYLFETAKRVGENARAAERRHPITPIVALSNGYDSPAAAVLAQTAGARHAVTIPKARRTHKSFISLDDSGAPIAEQLGLSCTAYSRSVANYPHEDSFWAAMGNVGDVNLALFDYPSPLCLLFNGFFGGEVWEKTTNQVEPLQRKGTAGARFSECRLELGVLNCAPAYWGCKQEAQVRKLSQLAEMAPWTMGGDYDRPIPRRIAEEAGVRRESFGTRKRAASFNRKFGRPLSANLRKDFEAFMEQQGNHSTSSFAELLSLGFRALDGLVMTKLPVALRPSIGTWVKLPDPNHFFMWANKRRKERYLAGLRASGHGDAAVKEAQLTSN